MRHIADLVASKYRLAHQDSVVYASVLRHLRSVESPACFLNRNSKDFDDPDIEQELAAARCCSASTTVWAM